MKTIILLLMMAGSAFAIGRPDFKVIHKEPFWIRLEPNQYIDIDIPNEAWIQPYAYCWVNGNVIRDEYSTGSTVALSYGHASIRAGFRFPVDVKITFFKAE